MKNYACRLIFLITLIFYSCITTCWPQEQDKFYSNEYRPKNPPPPPNLPPSSFGNEPSYGSSSGNNAGPAVADAAAAGYLYNQSQSSDRQSLVEQEREKRI